MLRPTKLLEDALIHTKDLKPLDGIRALNNLDLADLKYSIFARLCVAQSNKQTLMHIASKGNDIFPHPDPTMNVNEFALMTEFFSKNFSQVKAVRYHTISFPQGLKSSYSVLSKFNVKISSNMGFNDAVGFPGGNAYGIKFVQFGIVEIPIIFMDIIPFREGYTPSQTKRLIEKLLKELRKNNGISSFIFHIDYLHDPQFYDLLLFFIDKAEKSGVSIMSFGTAYDELVKGKIL